MEAIHPNTKKYAVKIIRNEDQELLDVAYEEYKLLRSLSHKNIVLMHDAFYNDHKSTIMLVMDLAPGKSLTQILESGEILTENE